MKRIHLLNKLRVDIAEWAACNFDFERPKLGVFEECGEMMNCILKRFQGIRGMDDPQLFKAKLLDAIGDAGIYLLHDMALEGESLVNEIELEEEIVDDCSPEGVEQHFADLADLLGQFLSQNSRDMLSGKQIHQALLDKLGTIAQIYEIDVIEAITYTWSQVVSKRNWKKDKLEGSKEENIPKGLRDTKPHKPQLAPLKL